MEQLYLVEIFVDKVTIFVTDEDEKSVATKRLIIKIKFGPKVEFIIKEGQLALTEPAKDDDIIENDGHRRKFSRTIRVGKSYLFPACPDTLLMTLSKFPLEIELWNDDEKEVEIFVGIGQMQWHTEFFNMLKDTADICRLHDPLAIKQMTELYAECCCKQCGEITFILRISALGQSIITEFQQPIDDPDTFVFRTNKAPSMFQCKRIEGDDPNFCMVGSLYETTTLEDPDHIPHERIEICTEQQSCGGPGNSKDPSCAGAKTPKKDHGIEKIKIGDITGPCGNANCALAQKVKNYIRQLNAYKKEAAKRQVCDRKVSPSRKVCGTCSCKDDRYHRDGCPEKDGEMIDDKEKIVCDGCKGLATPGETCEQKKAKFYGTGATPSGSKTHVAYVFSVTNVPNFKESVYGRKFISDNLGPTFQPYITEVSSDEPQKFDCCHNNVGPSSSRKFIVKNAFSSPNLSTPDNKLSTRILGINNDQAVYNAHMPYAGQNYDIYNCAEIFENKDCKCEPPKYRPPCNSLNCDCIMEIERIKSRKNHKPFCPLFQHKKKCPVLEQDNEEKPKKDEDEDVVEPLPYGLPPVKLGPCPVMCRPCSVPDGFAKLYKTALMKPGPPSHSDAGKVCCSKEFERIKKAIKEYLKTQAESDFRCINKFDVDTERRCCDKDQKLLSLSGKACCGSHKIKEKD